MNTICICLCFFPSINKVYYYYYIIDLKQIKFVSDMNRYVTSEIDISNKSSSTCDFFIVA